MSSINNTIAGLELAQIAWVVPDIHAAVKFFASALGITGFPEPAHIRAQDLDMTYYGKVVDAEWLTTQTYSGGTFIELIQPVSGQSMFHDYLARYPAGGTQHIAFRLPVGDFGRVTSDLREQVMPSSAKWTTQSREWLSSTPTKRWAWPLRLWASRRKDGLPSNKCRRPGDDSLGSPDLSDTFTVCQRPTQTDRRA
jgi:Glyoxalase/Bleomycin resistance protein/Dioxygenase superfamily